MEFPVAFESIDHSGKKHISKTTIKANTVTGAKRKLSNLHPTIKGKWVLHDGFTWIKQGEISTLYLGCPSELEHF